ncbi:hypothetical protein BDV12DRAFT_179502 [Aspergillus spectabilis]
MTRMAGQNGTHARTDDLIEPQFRLACEECHARKIRCELSLANSGGSCKACTLNQRRCLFSLRSRTGRPRKQPLSQPSPLQKPSSMQNRPAGSFPAEPSQPPLQMSASMGSGQAEEIGSRLQQNTGSLPDGQAYIWTPEENDPAGWNGFAWQSLAADPHPALASYPGPFEDLLQPGLCGWDAHFMIQGSGNGSLSDACISGIAPVADPLQIDTIIRLGSAAALDDNTGEARKGTREKGFLDALKLYSGLHNNCKSTTLDLLTEAGQYKVRSISKLFDELSQAAFALQADTLPSSSSPRSDISETEIIRVAIMEAIQVSIGIIQYNFQLHHSTTTRPVDGGLQCPSEQFCSDRPGSRNNEVFKTCNCLITADEKQLGIQLNCLKLLIRLEFSLIRFQHAMSKLECLHAGQRPSPQRLSCDCWVNSVPKVDTARSQVSVLLEQFRSLWD